MKTITEERANQIIPSIKEYITLRKAFRPLIKDKDKTQTNYGAIYSSDSICRNLENNDYFFVKTWNKNTMTCAIYSSDNLLIIQSSIDYPIVNYNQQAIVVGMSQDPNNQGFGSNDSYVSRRLLYGMLGLTKGDEKEDPDFNKTVSGSNVESSTKSKARKSRIKSTAPVTKTEPTVDDISKVSVGGDFDLEYKAPPLKKATPPTEKSNTSSPVDMVFKQEVKTTKDEDDFVI